MKKVVEYPFRPPWFMLKGPAEIIEAGSHWSSVYYSPPGQKNKILFSGIFIYFL
jgi:hypothetical protein